MILDPILDVFRGKAVTIPPLDGAFRPNTMLDDAEIAATLDEPDNLEVLEDDLLISSGNNLFRVESDSRPSLYKTFPVQVTAIAVSSALELAVGLETGMLLVDDVQVQLPDEVRCITALAFDVYGSLYLANGSVNGSPSQWKRDLMSHGKSGSVWVKERNETFFRKIAGGLAYPSGLVGDRESVVVSESWKHRLVRLDVRTGALQPIVSNLPGYPARISPAIYGGALLSIFAPLNRLIEFVLKEDHYRAAMMAEVPEEYWIAPALSSNRSFLEPLQCGAIRTMGIHKPWSPSRSYGLVVTLDQHFQPVFSFHSRANGSRHGTTSAVQLKRDGKIYVASKGGNSVLAVDLMQSR